MRAKPVLIIQPRRLGDLILTFPLMLAVQKRLPQSPIWIVAKPEFFKHLLPFAPRANFFDLKQLPELGQYDYEAVFNFGAEEQAALFTGAAKSRFKAGQYLQNGNAHIAGFWQLYRASLTQNNRHNLFHWADLNRLDFAPPDEWPRHGMNEMPRSGRLGLFIGASEVSKRPSAEFWGMLAKRLLAHGFRPILLGGPTEKAAGEQIARETKLGLANFCGKTSLTQLAQIIKSLDLLITPDTGPMHLADWLGIKVLNLSMGNVHVAETGPLSRGQLVVRAASSCYGCWRCSRPKLYCHQPFTPAAVGAIATQYLKGADLGSLFVPGLSLFQTGRDSDGLYELLPLGTPGLDARSLLDRFWQQAFLQFYSHNETRQEKMLAAAHNLANAHAALFKNMLRHLANLPQLLMPAIKYGKKPDDDFWKKQPPNLRLFSGWIHMRLENSNHKRDALLEIMELLSDLAKTLSALA